ncbi:mastin-like [Loxodonta africana]|uniref:mastin-like n=1 Tax=Loxodonta africana TaxID=9785 RepID=UPI0030CA7EBC
MLSLGPCLLPLNRIELGPSAYRVQVGQLKLYDHDQLMNVTKIIRHPKFNLSLSAKGGADIALLQLETLVMLSDYVQPVTLPPASLTVPSGKTCWVTGWGAVKLGAPLPKPYILQEVEIPIVGNEDCNRRYLKGISSNKTAKAIQDDMLCAGSEGRDSCQGKEAPTAWWHRDKLAKCHLSPQGDSGSPLACIWNDTWLQVGLVSWGDSCGHRFLPGVYARVMSYVSWIHQYVPHSHRL